MSFSVLMFSRDVRLHAQWCVVYVVVCSYGVSAIWM